MIEPTGTALVASVKPPRPIAPDLIREIAMDIGAEVAAHIELMYPRAVEAVAGSLLLSVRNRTYNEIMAALDAVDETEIRTRLADRRRFRRALRAT